MGKGGGGTTTVNNSSPPPEVMAQYQNVINQANAVAGTPYTTGGFNASNLIAPFNNTQNTAFSNINNAQGLAQPFINNAANLINNSQAPIWGNVPQYSSSINNYMNPYLDTAIAGTQRQMENMDAQQQQQVIGNAISKGAWGGDRAGIAQAELANQQDLANNSIIGQMENAGFAQQQQEFNQQQGAEIGAMEANAWLASQGAFGMANLGNESLNTTLTGANAELQAGNQQQQQSQAALNIPYEQFLAQQAYPYQNISWLSGISTGLGSGMGGTSTSTAPGPSGTSQAIGTGLGILGTAAMFLEKGGAVEPRGLGRRIHRDIGGMIPDMSRSYIPGAPQIPHMNSLPAVPKAPTPQASNNTSSEAGTLMGIASKLHKRGNSGPEPLSSMASTGFDVANAQANGLGDMVQGFQNPNGTTNLSSPVDINGDSVAIGSPDTSMLGGFLSHLGFARGGSPRHYDDGGGVGGMTPAALSNPVAQTQYDQLTTMPIEKLQELAVRVGNGPQSSLIRAALQKRLSQPMQPQGFTPGMARGGSAHYEDGGGGGALDPDENYSPAPADLPSVSTPMDADNAAKMKYLYADDQPAPQGFARPSAQALPDHDTWMANYENNVMNQEPINKPDPWMSLAKAGFAMAAGRSPHAMENIGAGALAGLEDYGNQKKQAAQESEKLGTLAEQGESLYNTMIQHKEQLAHENEQLAETSRHNQQDESLRLKQIEQGKYQATPYGQVLNTKTGELTGTNMFAPSGVGNATDSSGKPLTGAAYMDWLKQNDPEEATKVDSVLRGNMQITPYMISSKSPMAAAYNKLWNEALRADPDAGTSAALSMGRYADKQAFLKSGTKGANDLDTFNNVGGHLQLLEQAARAVDNKDTKALNAIRTSWKEQTGSELPTDLDTVKRMVSGELVKAVTGAGGVTDREQYQQSFDRKASEGQLLGAVEETKHLINQRIAAEGLRYKNTVGGDYTDNLLPSVKSYMQTPVNRGNGDTARVVSPDGKTVGTIPAARLKDYLANGYTQQVR